MSFNMVMKKIVFKTDLFPGNSETFIINQVTGAIKMGYDVSLIVNEKNDVTQSSQQELIKKYKLAEKTFEIKNIRPNNPLNVLFMALKIVLKKRYPAALLKTFNYFKYKKAGLSGRLFYDLISIYPFLNADLFHVQFGIFAEPLVRLKKQGLLKASIVTTFHGFDVHFNSNTYHKRKESYRNLFAVGSFFTCNTKYLANQLIQLGCPPEKLEIIPMGIDISFFKPLNHKKVSDRIHLISVGRLIKFKNHKDGIRAVAELIERGYDVFYTIIGEGKEYKNLKNLINKLGLVDHVLLAGAKSQKFIRDTMQRADIFLMTSVQDETGRRETQGVVTGEAQACGLPVVAFNSGGVPYTMIDGETGFLSEENDYQDMAKNIEKLITNPGLRKQMSEKARQFVTEHYALESSAEKMQMLYQKLLQQN